jgi:XRE family transcriptional regulator, aerobic/anaerobic benzoate catabolism transcriptional regulator
MIGTQRDTEPRIHGKSFNARVGGRIRDVRSRRGLPQRDLAHRTGIHPSRLSKYESGTHAPSARCLSLLAAALGVSVDVLLPEIPFQDDADRELHRVAREIWLLSAPAKALAASVLRVVLEHFRASRPAPR